VSPSKGGTQGQPQSTTYVGEELTPQIEAMKFFLSGERIELSLTAITGGCLRQEMCVMV